MEMTPGPTREEAFAALSEALDALEAVKVSPADAREALARLEPMIRKVESLQDELVAGIDRAGIHLIEGHASAAAMVRHHVDLMPDG